MAYQSCYFDISDLEPEKVPYAKLLSELLGDLPTRKHSLEELVVEKNMWLGNVRAYLEAYTKADDLRHVELKFVMDISCLEQNLLRAVKLGEELLYDTILEHPEIILKRIRQSRMELDVTLVNLVEKVVNDEPWELDEGILHHEEGVDFLPANIELAGMETTLVNMMSRETILRQYIDRVRERYDFILLDTMPSLGMITINALVAADSVLIPVESAYLSVKGLQQLIKTIGRVRRQLNRDLEIEGILLTKVDRRTNYAKDISDRLREAYGDRIHIFENCIPLSIKAAETSAEGKSIFIHAPKGIVAEGYAALTKEVLSGGES